MTAEEFLAHLANALGRYVRASGQPGELRELRMFAELCLRIASGGQDGPTSPSGLVAVSVPGDGRPVKVALDIPAVADALSVGERTARRLIASGELPSVLIRGRRLVRMADLERYLASKASTPFREAITTKGNDLGGVA